MNALTPVTYHPQLPAYMQDPSLFASSDAAIAGISGGSPPMVSIKGSKFHLVGSDGEIAHVQQLHLDVVVLAGNAHVSKTYYAEAYNPADAEAKPPTCFSDNGTAPSSSASTPQSAACATCPHAAWGSKITPAGSKIKACSDSKKLAVVLGTDTQVVFANGAAGVLKAFDQVWLLRVPAASMSTWRVYGKSILDRGIPLPGIVSRITFDPQADYPALLFQAVSFVQDEATFRSLVAKKDQSAVLDMIGANDRPLSGAAVSASTSVAALPPPPAHLAAPAPAAAAVPPPTTPAVTPVPPAPTPSIPLAAPSAAPAAATSGTRRRGRPPAQPAAASSPAPATPGPVPAAAAPAPFPAPTPAPTAPAASGVIVQPAATDASLDALLASALNG